ncbi:MAG: hypothetical protein JW724_06555 [Candidatus Altiarchaeota archaeon]|nr:hypothetical protein [Candidatus Altiarchaeota archaeon]
MKREKGYILTFDAMLASLVVITVFIIAFQIQIQSSVENTGKTEFKRVHYIAEDAIEVLNKKGVLDEIGREWAEANRNTSSAHWINASNIARQHLTGIIPEKMGYKLMVDNETLYEHAPVPEEKATTKTRSLRILSGYTAGEPTLGYVARAYLAGLKKERQTLLTGWQRTTSSGENDNRLHLTTTFTLPNDFTTSKCNHAHLQALSRVLPNEWFRIWINNLAVCEGTECEFNILDRNDLCDHLRRGLNKMEFEVWDTQAAYEIGKGSGTRMVIDYNTSGMGFNVTKIFPVDQVESSCVVKQQMSMLMPGDIKSIKTHLETEGVETVALGFVWKSTIYQIGERDATGGIVEFSDSEIRNALGGITYEEIRGRDFSFNIYLDTRPQDYESGGKTPPCGDYRTRKILPGSYIEVDYSPFPPGTDTYGYNTMTTPLKLTEAGETCVEGYTTVLEGNYTLPVNCLPWTVDVWLAWIASGASAYQEFTANDITLHKHPTDPFERYMIRLGYSTAEYAGVISPGANGLRMEGANLDMDQFCLSKSLTSGVVTFLFKAYVDYGEVYRYSDGCRLTINFEDDTTITIGNSTDVCEEDHEDAASDAMLRLAEQLDFDMNGKADVKFDPNEFTIENAVQTRVRSLWGPTEFRIVVWI